MRSRCTSVNEPVTNTGIPLTSSSAFGIVILLVWFTHDYSFSSFLPTITTPLLLTSVEPSDFIKQIKSSSGSSCVLSVFFFGSSICLGIMFNSLCVGSLCQLIWFAFFWPPVTKMALQINILLSYFIYTFLRDKFV